jgi:nitrogenase molybdenum-iron protein alpha/beta subunit
MLLRHTTYRNQGTQRIDGQPGQNLPAHRGHVRRIWVFTDACHTAMAPRDATPTTAARLTRHFKEPVVAATSAFTEGASVFGGQANLLQAIDNIFTVYNPDVIAVHTTCLSETIGDDIPQIVNKAKADGKVPEGK